MELGRVNRILIINLGGIGDLLLSSPAIKALKAGYNESVIDIIVVSRAVEVAYDLRLFSNVYVFKNSLRQVFSLLFSLRKHNYDIAINMRTIVSWPGACKMFCIFKTIRPRISVGRNTDGRGFFFNIRIPETLRGEKYEMEYDIDTVNALGIEVNDRAITYEVKPEAVSAINKLFNDKGVSPQDKIVVIHPGGALSHRWPIKNYAELIKQLSLRRKFTFIITGSRDEAGLGEKLVALGGSKIINFAGKLEFPELFVLIQKCSIFICNDTGPMHLAAILKIPLVSIFGPGYLKRFDPRNISGNARVLYKASSCSPCDRKKCRSQKCLQQITVEEVLQEAFGLLKS